MHVECLGCDRQSKLLLWKMFVQGVGATGVDEKEEVKTAEEVGLPWVKEATISYFSGGRWGAGKIDALSLFSSQMGLGRFEKDSLQFWKALVCPHVVFYDSQNELNNEGPHSL